KRCLAIESRWSPAGPGLRGAGISVTRDRFGHRIVFARGYDDTLYVRWQRDADPIPSSSVLGTTHWSRWHSFGEKISSDPVAFMTAFPGQPDNPVRAGVIARFADESRYQASTLDDFASVARIDPHDPTRYSPFLDMESIGSPPGVPRYASQPTVIQRGPDGRPWAFCHNALNKPLGESNTFYSVWDDNRWGTWTPFGHSGNRIAGNITGCSYSDGTLELFARAADNTILHSFTEGGSAPANWETTWSDGGLATSDLLVVLADDESMLDVF